MKAIISVTIDTDVLLQARRKNINISAAAENGIIGSLGANYKPDEVIQQALMLTTDQERKQIDKIVENEAYDALRRMTKLLNTRAGCHMTPGQLFKYITRRQLNDKKNIEPTKVL